FPARPIGSKDGTLALKTRFRQRRLLLTAIPARHGLFRRAMLKMDQVGSLRASAVRSCMVRWVSGVGRLWAEVTRHSTLVGVGSTSLRTASSPARADAA